METLLNEKEAAEFLGITEDYLNRMIAYKLIPAYKIAGKFLRFKKEELATLKDMLKENAGFEDERIFSKEFSEVKGFERVKEILRANDVYLVIAVVLFLILGYMFVKFIK
jgi:excisionase family DNA binding protein